MPHKNDRARRVLSGMFGGFGRTFTWAQLEENRRKAAQQASDQRRALRIKLERRHAIGRPGRQISDRRLPDPASRSNRCLHSASGAICSYLVIQLSDS